MIIILSEKLTSKAQVNFGGYFMGALKLLGVGVPQ